MRTQLLITAVGEDRPGIVASITEVLVKHGANLEESRMAILGGEFAAVMLVSLPDGSNAALVKGLEELKNQGISITTKGTTSLSPDRFKEHLTCELSLRGADHEGIVHKVSTYLQDREINIQSMETEIVSAPVTGVPLFSMKAVIQVPPRISMADLRKSLGIIGDSEGVDIEVRELSAVAIS